MLAPPLSNHTIVDRLINVHRCDYDRWMATLRPIVREKFLAFTAPLEGCVRYFYLDILGLVTVAYGCLVATEAEARALPMVRSSGTAATPEECAEDWHRVKGTPALAQRGFRAAATVARLRLTPDGVEAVTWAKLDKMLAHLERRFPDFAEWPASAQLAVVSLSWACGPAFAFPKCVAALQRQDWAGAAAECQMRTAGNPGLVPRNRANRALLLGAAAGGDPEALVGWP